MKKGKSASLVLLLVEILVITILHAVKINQAGKPAGREAGKEGYSIQAESKLRPTVSLAVYK